MDESHLIALINSLVELTRKVSLGEYDEADKLFEFTKQGKYPPLIHQLAEAFGMMIVKVEGREFHLEQIIEELAAKNRELEATLRRVHLLESVRNQLSKFVPSSVKELIENNPDNPDLEKKNRDVTVLFLDLAGYTKMSEQVEQEKVNYLIQTYFSSFLDAIIQNKGDINETAGDGLMVIFQDPDPRLHAVNAVRTGVIIQERTSRLNREHRAHFEPVCVNIGINSGPCSVGSTRYEGITGTRWTFTASGPVTNVAARIASVATEGAVLVGPETHERVKDVFRLAFVGESDLKNISKPVALYRVLMDG
jgi:class 3 adenylate cyclase